MSHCRSDCATLLVMVAPDIAASSAMTHSRAHCDRPWPGTLSDEGDPVRPESLSVSCLPQLGPTLSLTLCCVLLARISIYSGLATGGLGDGTLVLPGPVKAQTYILLVTIALFLPHPPSPHCIPSNLSAAFGTLHSCCSIHSSHFTSSLSHTQHPDHPNPATKRHTDHVGQRLLQRR